MKKPWRAGWLGKLLGIHSPSAHGLLGTCWCQKKPVSMCFDCLMHPQDSQNITLLVESDDCGCCANKHFGYKEENKNG